MFGLSGKAARNKIVNEIKSGEGNKHVGYQIQVAA